MRLPGSTCVTYTHATVWLEVALCVDSLPLPSVESGQVRIRDWSSVQDQGQRAVRAKSRPKRGQLVFHKTKLCWFAQHHPQGCPRGDGACTYAHSKEELRERPNFDSENELQMR